MIKHVEGETNINRKALSYASIALSKNGYRQAQPLCSKLTIYHGASL
ncbi:alpha-ribazole phosphatase [Acinetobacter sp. AKBS16]|nr:alpha-ribazole phosphatase [Acinetobacter sp. AKBS16]